MPYAQPTPVKSWKTGTMAGAKWLIKANDYAEFPAGYGRWAWVTCGESVTYGGDAPFRPSTDPTYPDWIAPCEQGQVPTFTNYWALLKWLDRGNRHGRTVLFDPEVWSWTPAREQARQAYYIGQGCEAAAEAGVIVIVSPGGYSAGIGAEWNAAAEYCSIAEVQAQGWVSSAGVFQHRVGRFLRIVRTQHHAVPMVGLATDTAGGTNTVPDLLAAFRWARAHYVRRFWMNACAWWGRPGEDGTGDPGIAESFFSRLGMKMTPARH